MQSEIFSDRVDIVERSFRFAIEIVRFCRTMDGKPGAQRVLVTQLLRAGTSVGANVEEAQAGQSKADFASKISIALKEARETRYWLRLMAESGIIERILLDPLIKEATELSRVLGAIAASARGRSRS